MKLYYPIAIKLKDKHALVVGGGQVAARKVKALRQFGVRVRVVSPSLVPALKKLVKSRKIVWLNKKVESSDAKGIDIVIAATSIASINQKISSWAKREGVLVNVVDNTRLSTFISPAVFSKGKAIVAVYTDGRDPALSRDLKNFLKEHWNEFLSYRHRL
ncbi:MAG: bifunctional precorrin-2 dehydrogenase/sirohydrochlorin ferrochelatase [Candidatus Omnitrophota bacterium]|nr:bifunctional precorrin-2 dehydrogenase/sirohydrochlorin ferrochelatase [Candidatus Omnitrophota bacterium]